jgi:hypothetical protein
MPVPLEINLSNSDSDSGNMSKCIDLDIWVDKGRETFEFSLSSKSKPLSVIVDPDDVIIGLDENNEMAVKAL